MIPTTSIRKANISDIPFLVEVVIEADKSGGEKSSFVELYNTPIEKCKSIIEEIFLEDMEGCELSVSSFLIAEQVMQPVGAFAAWVEGDNENRSGTIKANLLGYYFGFEKMANLKKLTALLNSFLISKTFNTLQFEYLYVKPSARGQGIPGMLITEHIKMAKQYSNTTLAEVQLLGNNLIAQNVYQRHGFVLSESKIVEDTEILYYFNDREKIKMIKNI